VSGWRVALEARGLGAVSIDVRITAVRKLAVEAADNRLLAPELANGITRVKGVASPPASWMALCSGPSTAATTYPALSEKVVWQMLRPYAAAASVPGIAPHDCRRTAAKLCRAAGGELEQIHLLLGHASVQTTKRYLGTKQDLVHAPNGGIMLRVTRLPSPTPEKMMPPRPGETISSAPGCHFNASLSFSTSPSSL
jgi:hypothetical protein